MVYGDVLVERPTVGAQRAVARESHGSMMRVRLDAMHEHRASTDPIDEQKVGSQVALGEAAPIMVAAQGPHAERLSLSRRTSTAPARLPGSLREYRSTFSVAILTTGFAPPHAQAQHRSLGAGPGRLMVRQIRHRTFGPEYLVIDPAARRLENPGCFLRPTGGPKTLRVYS